MKKFFNTTIFGIVLLAILYVAFLGRTVFNIVERKSLENEYRALANEVSELELNYLSVTEKIDLKFSMTRGFKEINPEYISRNPIGTALLVKNEI
ncbi:MAG: hypothetical protein WC898_03540 [Candidatus Paceibacterota bacterium]|jgi:hypothetical protein